MGNLKIIRRYNPNFMIPKEILDKCILTDPELVTYIFICRLSSDNVRNDDSKEAIKLLSIRTGYTYGITKYIVESLIQKKMISVNQSSEEYTITLLK